VPAKLSILTSDSHIRLMIQIVMMPSTNLTLTTVLNSKHPLQFTKEDKKAQDIKHSKEQSHTWLLNT